MDFEYNDRMIRPQPSIPDANQTPVMVEHDHLESQALSLRGGRPPLKVPGYEQEAFLGKGAYGEVWVAIDSNSGRKVAIKYYTRRGGTDWAALAREVEKLRYLFNDRYVVQLIKVGWDAEPPYYVMEYLENGSLEDLLRAGPISVHQAVALFRAIAKGLVHAHDKGILHCDLKPANVLLDEDFHPRLGDFGQSRLTNELSPALGTLFYMAPEQADLKAAPDARWDVYSLGAVMYRMLTGQPPHRNESTALSVMGSGTLDAQLAAYRSLLETEPQPVGHRRVPGVDSRLAGIVSRCLASHPRHRYPNPQAVLTDLDAWSLSRIRRPLLWLSGLTFAALFVIMAMIGTSLFQDTVSTAEREVIEGSLEGNRFAAQSAAERHSIQAQYRWQVLEQAARHVKLREWLTLDRKQIGNAPIETWLAEQKKRYDGQVDDQSRSSLWLALNNKGLVYGMAPTLPKERLVYRGYHDYFHGKGHELGAHDTLPPLITRPTRTSVFKRKANETDEYWSVAFSVPVGTSTEKKTEPIGVLAMTFDLKGQIRVEGERERFAVLVDTRPDLSGKRGLIVRHPYLESEQEGLAALYYNEAIVRWVDSGMAEFPEERDYTDPVGGEYAGAWLASAERIVVRLDGGPVDTGWVVLIQERKNDVMAPVRALQWRLGYGAAGAVAVILLLVLLMWAGMMSVVDASSRSRMTRLLRRLAGLPAPANATQTVGSMGYTSKTPTAGISSSSVAPLPPSAP